MKKYIILILSAFAILAVSGIEGMASGSVVVDRVVAVVNDEIITLSDLQREEKLKKVDVKKDERLLLEDMIDRKLQMAAAKRAGIDVTDKELDDAIAYIMKRDALDRAKFEAALSKEGLTVDQYKTDLREDMTLSRVISKFGGPTPVVGEAEARAYYERNIKSYLMPEEIRIRQIFYKLPENATPAEIAAIQGKAMAAYARAKKGEDFESLVNELSDDETVANGGDLGFMQRDQVIPEIEEATRGLTPGGIAGPIKCAGGFHIIKLEEIRRPVKPFEKVKDDITKMLFKQKMEISYRTLLQTLRSDSHIENLL